MKFWDDLSPFVRRTLIAAAVFLGILLVVRQVASTPAGNITHVRGINAKP